MAAEEATVKGLDAIAKVVRAVFTTQRQQAKADKEKFGDWNQRFASMLEKPMLTLYLESAKSSKLKAQLVADFTVTAKNRASIVAQEINDTTSDWLQEGRELKDVFSVARVVRIATTEAAFALRAGKALKAKSTGKRLRWRARANACKFCRQMNGKVVKVGKAFGINAGRAIQHPPAHPH